MLSSGVNTIHNDQDTMVQKIMNKLWLKILLKHTSKNHHFLDIIQETSYLGIGLRALKKVLTTQL